MVMWFAWVIWGEFFSQENTPEGHTETHKSSFFPHKQVSGRNSDHEWLRMTNAFILYDLVWKVQKSHAANREGSFNHAYKWDNWWKCAQFPVIMKSLLTFWGSESWSEDAVFDNIWCDGAHPPLEEFPDIPWQLFNYTITKLMLIHVKSCVHSSCRKTFYYKLCW